MKRAWPFGSRASRYYVVISDNRRSSRRERHFPILMSLCLGSPEPLARTERWLLMLRPQGGLSTTVGECDLKNNLALRVFIRWLGWNAFKDTGNCVPYRTPHLMEALVPRRITTVL